MIFISFKSLNQNAASLTNELKENSQLVRDHATCQIIFTTEIVIISTHIAKTNNKLYLQNARLMKGTWCILKRDDKYVCYTYTQHNQKKNGECLRWNNMKNYDSENCV